MSKLIECIPNFSTSKEQDPAVFEQLVEVAKNAPGCTLFDVQSDGSHNRCVFAKGQACTDIVGKSFGPKYVPKRKFFGQHADLRILGNIDFLVFFEAHSGNIDTGNL